MRSGLPTSFGHRTAGAAVVATTAAASAVGDGKLMEENDHSFKHDKLLGGLMTITHRDHFTPTTDQVYKEFPRIFTSFSHERK